MRKFTKKQNQFFIKILENNKYLLLEEIVLAYCIILEDQLVVSEYDIITIAFYNRGVTFFHKNVSY